MPDKKQYTEKTEVTTETAGRKGSPERDESAYKKTTVKTERKVEKDDDKVIIIDE